MSRAIVEIAPSSQDAASARVASRALMKLIQGEPGEEVEIDLHADDDTDTHLVLPLPAIRLLVSVLQEMAKGNGVSIVPVQAELTTNQAAAMLNVSRPYLIKLLDGGKIPFHLVGSHRRIRFQDMVRYMKDRKAAAILDLAQMAADAQALGLY